MVRPCGLPAVQHPTASSRQAA